MSPARRRACPMSCVAITILTPEAANRARCPPRTSSRRDRGSRSARRETEFGIARERAREREPLLLAARKFSRRAIGEMREAHLRQQFGDTLVVARRQRIGDVRGGRPAQHHGALEHHGESFARHGAPAPTDAPACGRDEPHRQTDERAFARTVRPEQHRRRAGAECQSKIAHDLDLADAQRCVFNASGRSVIGCAHRHPARVRRRAARPRRAHSPR